MADTTTRMLEFEKAVEAVVVTDVQISPGGNTVAYVTSKASATGDRPTSAIWLVSAAGSAPRRLSTSEGIDGAPRWAPDERSIAFLSDRKERGKLQLHLIALSGGEAVRLTDAEGGLVDIDWSPDGARIAFTAMDAETEDEKTLKEESGDTKVVDEHVKMASLWVLDVPDDPATLAPGDLPEPKRLSPEGLHIGSFGQRAFSWAPDSLTLVAVAAASPKAHDLFIPDIITISLDGEANNLGAFEGINDRPVYSPDGSTIGFIGCEERIPSFFSMRVIPAKGGESTVALPKHEASFYGVAWLPDGDRMLAISEEGERRTLRILDPETRKAEPALDGWNASGSITLFSATRDGGRVAFVYRDATSHGDLWVADLRGAPRKLTDLNPWTRDYDWGETREISWTAADGLKIQGLLILPVGYEEGTRYPLLLHIHGGPCSAWSNHLCASWNHWGQFMAQRGYAILMPNPRGSSGRGSDFLCEILSCYGEPDWQDLMSGVDYVIDQGIADPGRLVVGGWSGGGFLTNWTVTHTDRFKAAVSGAGISNWVSFQGTADVRSVFDRYLGPVDTDPEGHWRLSPIRYIQNAVTPTLILYGDADARVPPSQGYEMYEGLKSRGVKTQLVLYPGEPHGIGGRKHQLDLLKRVVAWYDCHLGKD
ncbi:MAG TPA: S9 family peptidase [Thermomicrobiales bacterium]|nr:S9 family peptidase [Thermomicrobiales bacterium]